MTAFRLVVLATLPFLAAPVVAAELSGVWQSEDADSRIRIAACGASLCATLAWLREGTDAQGAPRLDAANADPARRTRPLIGTALFANMVRSGDLWRGRIYNPDDGKTYEGTIALNGRSIHGLAPHAINRLATSR